MKYCIWNNKGGIGKTFLSFCLCVEYAINNPEKDVVAVDMCPQANLSEMILGGNGKGQDNQTKLCENELTIPDYIKTRYSTNMWSKLGTEITYFIKADTYNTNMPSNLHLLCGDIDLDLCSRLIEELGRMSIQGAWKRSRSYVLDLLQTYEKNSKKETVFFIDCNPSFSTYTEMAVLSSDRLIIPCTADFASMKGIENVFKIIYDSNATALKDSIIKYDNFSLRVKENGMSLPKVHSFLLNKSRTKEKKATKAYMAHANKINAIAAMYEKESADNFVISRRQQQVLDIKDGNNLVLVLNHDGLPLSKIHGGAYKVYGVSTQVDQEQLDNILKDIMQVVDTL